MGRAAIARAAVGAPDLILADEPTGNLDSASARSVLEMLAELRDHQGLTVLMVTHDPFAASHAGRVVFMKDGQVFSTLDRAATREGFFQEILDALAVLEAEPS